MSSSEKTLEFILSAVRHLAKNGILVPTVYKTRDGKDFINVDGVCYIVFEAINGNNPTYGTRHLPIVVSGLAKFHKASKGYVPPYGSKPKCHLGTWIDDYTRQLENMNTLYEEDICKKRGNSIDILIKEEFPGFYSRAGKVIEGLKKGEYMKWSSRANSEGCLCHQDFAAGNLILSSERLYILDMDSVTMDIPARDIRKLINKVMKKNGKWDTGLARKILGYYQAVNPLRKEEWEVVALDIMFPHLFLGAFSKYYYKRDNEWSYDKYYKRMREMADFEKTKVCIADEFKSFV
jgi:spore coat-associated protein S